MIRYSDYRFELIKVGTKVVTKIYAGLKVVWQSILGCFTEGYWLDTKGWTNDQGWNNG